MGKHSSSLLFIFFSTHLTLIFFDFKFRLTLNMKTKWFFNTPTFSRHYNDTNLNGQISYTNFERL